MSLFTRKIYRSMLKRLFRYASIPEDQLAETAHRFEGLRVAPEPTVFSDTFDIFYKHQLLGRSHSQTELEKGMDEIFVIGAGPSIRQLDLSYLEGKKSIYINGAINLLKSIQTQPYFVVVTDSYSCTFILDQLHLIPPGTNFMLSFQALKEIAHYDIEIIKKNQIFLNHFKSETMFLCNTDPEKAVEIFDKHDYGRMDGGTTLAEAVRLAAYLDAAKTYILGLDFTLSNNTTHFYKDNTKKLKNNYYEKDDYVEQKVLPFMRVASTYFKRNNREIYNCSPTTKIPYDIFPYSDLFEKKVGNSNVRAPEKY